MTTMLKLGKADHGRPLTLDEFWHSDYMEGYRYELIDGKLYVCPQPNLPEARVDRWITRKLEAYSDQHPEIINAVFNKARVFVPGRPGATVPEPDVAAYHAFPLNVDFRAVRWHDVSPLLVVEVLSAEDPDKDLVRNVRLYHQVPSISEYWIFDGRIDPNRPLFTARRRYGRRWRLIHRAFGDTYTTRLLPGFELLIDPHS
jgi:Uma2 family endonuclease